MRLERLRAIQAGATSLIAALCDEVGLEDIVNSVVRWDERQWKLSPGVLCKALVVNVLAGRKPLYKVEEFYAEQDVEKVLGEGVKAENINDDALGRTLDRMAEVDLKALFSSVSLSCVLKDDIEVKSVHADTTSISVYGEYEDGGIIEINHGYSKDKRPDLQQFVYGLLVNTEGIPLAGDVLSGNTSDRTWNGKVIKELEGLFKEHGKDIVYVADSALVSKDNLDLMAKEGIRFISRVPGTFGVEEAIKDIAWEKDDWVEMGTFSERHNAATYRAQSFEQEINGRGYRFIAVRSTSLDRQKDKTLTKRLVAESLEIEKAAKELGKKGFYCQADAEQAGVDFQKEYGKHFSMDFQVKPEVTIIRGRGRPRKGIEPVTKTHYQVVFSVGPARQEAVQRTRERLSTFVLITNVPPEEMDDREVLSEYKSQGRTVETKFRFLKDPTYVDGIYLKSVNRAYALAYVFLLALLIATYLERRVRVTLAARNDTIKLPGKRVVNKPTVASLLEMLRSLQVILVDTGKGTLRVLPSNTNPEILKALKLAGFSEDIYLK